MTGRANVGEQLLGIETPFGRPVKWASVAMVSDAGDAHDLNDDRCLILTSRDLGDRARGPLRDFMLCLLADGATGSTFSPHAAKRYAGDSPKQAGWRASQLAQAAFVERFLNSEEVDVLDRLKDGLRAADRALVESTEGSLSTTLVAVFLAADGTACAASIGDSVLLVLPPKRGTAGERRLKKLGYEDATAVGSGDTTLSFVDETQLIEQWWPGKEAAGGGASPKLTHGTYLVLMSDGVSDNLPAETIDRMLHRHAIGPATVALASRTRERRIDAQKRSGGSTQQLGLDNMSAIVIRFEGGRVAAPASSHRQDATLLSLLGTHGGPSSEGGGQFGMVCLSGTASQTSIAPTFVRQFLESEHTAPVAERMRSALMASGAPGAGSVFAAHATTASGETHAIASGNAQLPAGVRVVEHYVDAARETALHRFIYTPAIWGSSLAALAIFLLVSTAFATGTLRPAPPAPSLPRPGDPTPTPDTRPALSFGGFVLQPPVAPVVPTPTPTPLLALREADDVADAIEVAGQTAEAQDTALPPAPPPSQQPAACTNFLGIGCAPPPAPPARRLPPSAPVSVPSPSALSEQQIAGLRPADPNPPAGSTLDAALKGALAADENFSREVDPRSRGRP